MKPGINQWAFPDEMCTKDTMAWAKKVGFTAFEPCISDEGVFTIETTEAEATDLRRQAEADNMLLHSVASGLGWKYPLSSPDPAIRAKGREATAKMLQIASWLGAKALLVVPGIVTPEVRYDIALENALSSIRELVPVAEKCKVSIAVENVWNKLLLSPVEMRDFIDACESEYVGAYVDVGNVILYGYPEHYIEILGRRIHAIHMKDFRGSAGNMDGFVMLMEGDVNWPAVMFSLRNVGYDGALTAEYWTYTHSREAMLNQVFVGLTEIMKL